MGEASGFSAPLRCSVNEPSGKVHTSPLDRPPVIYRGSYLSMPNISKKSRAWRDFVLVHKFNLAVTGHHISYIVVPRRRKVLFGHGHETDAAIERFEHFLLAYVAGFGDQIKDRLTRPSVCIHNRIAVAR